MNFKKRKDVSIGLLVTFILFLPVIGFATSESGFQVESLELIVYRDGLVHVTKTLVVNETVPTITLPLLSSSVNDIIVLDGNKTILDYEVENLDLTIFSLGVNEVLLEYDTVSLTLKDAEVWTLVLDNSYNSTVLLPEGSTIIFLSEIPTGIETTDDKIELSLHPGFWEISYIFQLVSIADFKVSDFDVSPTTVEVGQDVKISARITNIGIQSRSDIISFKINETVEYTQIVTLAPGESTLIEFTVAKDEEGKYEVEIADYNTEFTVNTSSFTPIFNFILIIVVLALIILFILLFVFLRRRKPNIDRIFRNHPSLRQEDIDVLRFLSENNGKVFEGDLRKRFPDIPRTSLWRLVRRLEKLEIVNVKKIGLENQVELKK